jgi:microcystin-dependent protein
MADPFIGEIRMFACSFAPKGWARCEGQLLPLSQNTALFSVLGVMYGGDGRSTFGLPDLRGAVPIASGESTTGTTYYVGETGGANTVGLSEATLPAHTHDLRAASVEATTPTPGTATSLAEAVEKVYKEPDGAVTQEPMAPYMLAPAGNSYPHDNMMPYLALTFCIALQGVYPPRW